MPDESTNSVPRAQTVREVLEEEYACLRGEGPPPPATAGNGCGCDAGEEARRLSEHYKRVNRKDAQPLAALCLSGGGIRSASFSLGVIQGLAKRNLLPKFDYLSTVSGGGYVGGWLSAWIHRHAQGVEGVSDDLRNGRAIHGTARAVEPEPIAHLREYANYLAPRLGLFSLDMWTLAATYLRNLLLNWLVLLPLLAGALLLPRVYVAALFLHLGQDPQTVAYIGTANGLLWVLGTVVAVMWLPSLRAGEPAPGMAAVPPKRFGATGITWMILVPVTVASAVSALRWRWDPVTGAVTKLLLSVGILYALAGLIASALAWRGSSGKSLLRLWYLLLGSYGTAIASSFGVRWVIARIANAEGLGAQAWVARHVGQIACFGVPVQLGLFLLMLTLFAGLTSRDSGPDADDDREWWGRLMGAVLRLTFFWLFLMMVVLYGPRLVYVLRYLRTGWGTFAAGASAVAGFVGMLGGFSDSSGEQHGTRDLTWKQKLAHALPSVASKFFVVAVLVALSALVNSAVCKLGEVPVSTDSGQTTYLACKLDVRRLEPLLGGGDEPGYRQHFPPLIADLPTPTLAPRTEPAVWRPDLLLAASAALASGLLAYVLLVGRALGLNRLSLHAIYRSRLTRTFLGASNSARNAEPFTGFDRQDNVPMHHLRRLGMFYLNDLVDDPADPHPASQAPRPDPGDPRYARVRGLVDLWRADSQPLGRYVKDQLRTDPKTAGLVELITEGAPPNADWRAIGEAVVVHLNNLLRDRRLAEHSEYAGWLRGPRPDRLSELGRAKWDIYHACRQFRVDGCPRLLNRLILEEASVYNGRKLLAPAARLPKPLHVVNLALNLVAGTKLAWQQRKAGSFTVSPLHCGFVPQPELRPDGSSAVRGGYRPSVRYGNGISLGTAVAISGAAASPNMGYHSSPSVAFLMTLFNLRLGWWLGNPAERSPANAWEKFVHWIAAFPGGRDDGCGGTTWRLAYPRHHLRPLIDEALARTSDDNEYVYLSDGGHFENLGLYEMVRRRCRLIVVSDATADPQTAFGDLGNAIRKIRIDLGVPIQIDDVRFFPGVEKKHGKYCAVGMIDYRAADGNGVEQGTLIYVKAAMRVNAPVDVYNYARTSRTFPHESTMNQFFGESQFESYRRLGEECIDFLCGNKERRRSWEDHNEGPPVDDRAPISLQEFVKRAREHVVAPPEDTADPADAADAAQNAGAAETATSPGGKGRKPSGQRRPRAGSNPGAMAREQDQNPPDASPRQPVTPPGQQPVASSPNAETSVTPEAGREKPPNEGKPGAGPGAPTGEGI